MPAVLPTSSGVISATQTNAQQKVAFGSMLDYLAERLGAFTTTGTSTAYIGTPVPAVTAYFAGLSFVVTLHTASGASPTLQISGLPTPPNIVRRLQNGAYQNVSSLPAGPYRITLVSATQALAESVDPLIVGTVSQVASVPTGAIIEAGSNANGSYTRWADGTQICTVRRLGVGQLTQAIGVLFTSPGDETWTFPAAFVGLLPVEQGRVTGGTPYAWLMLGSVASSGLTTMIYRPIGMNSVAAIPECSLTAIGRWF